MIGIRFWMVLEVYKYEWIDEFILFFCYYFMKFDVYGFGIMCCEILLGEELY